MKIARSINHVRYDEMSIFFDPARETVTLYMWQKFEARTVGGARLAFFSVFLCARIRR